MNKILGTDKLPFVLLLTIFLPLIYLVNLGETPFYSVGEPREAVVAQSMYINNSLLIPYRFDNELATKPPLLHWSMAAVAYITGSMNEFASRLPSALAALAAMFSWYFFVRNICNARLALLSVLLLACFPEWYRHGTSARVDMLLSSAITLALISLYYWSKRPSLTYALCSTIFLAAGVLCKGPVAVVVPGAILLLWLWYSGKLNYQYFLKLCAICSLSLLPLITWYYLTYLQHGPEILNIFLSENVLRFLGNMDAVENPHQHGTMYLLATLLTGTAPWSLLAIAALLYMMRKRGVFISEQSQSEKALTVYCIIVTACFFAFYCIPSSKRAVYLLPAYPAVATLLGVVFQELRKHFVHASKSISIVVVSALLLLWTFLLTFRLGFIDISPLLTRQKDKMLLDFITSVFVLDHISLYQFLPLLIMTATLAYLCYYKGSRICGSAILVGFTSCLIRTDLLTPYASALSPQKFVQSEIKDHYVKELSIYNDRMYAEVFYARAIEPSLKIKHYEDGNMQKYILLSTDKVSELEEGAKSTAIYQHRSPTPVEKPDRNIELAILDTPSATAHK